MNKESVLFTPGRVGSLSVPNRFVRSATHAYMALDDGTVTEAEVELVRRLAEGEVGLVITGHAHIQPGGKASPRQIGAFDDRFIEGLGRIASAVHRFPSRVFLQIAHAGRQTKEKLCGSTPVSPSAVFDPSSKVLPRELSSGEIRALIEDFVRAGNRAKRAGFDGVQIHAAHGYLLSGFISPHTNRRDDEWGGSVENRARILVEVLRGLRAVLGRDFPVIVKLNTTDYLDGGLGIEDAVAIAKLLAAEGIDAIEASGGTAEAGKGSVQPGLLAEEDEGYFAANAARLKRETGLPVFALGGIRTLAVAERIVRDGRADFVSMSRPFIRNPFLVRDFKAGRVSKSACISCNKCFNPRGIRCAELEDKKH